MPTDPTRFLPLQRFEDPNGPRTWEDFELSPESLFAYLVSFFAIDPQTLDRIQRFFIGEVRPETDTIWINNNPTKPFIGVPVGGSFVKFYRYPPNVPFVMTNQEHLKYGARQMTGDEVTSYGLPTLSGTAFWAMLTED